jgi:hypothetical protein
MKNHVYLKVRLIIAITIFMYRSRLISTAFSTIYLLFGSMNNLACHLHPAMEALFHHPSYLGGLLIMHDRRSDLTALTTTAQGNKSQIPFRSR